MPQSTPTSQPTPIRPAADAGEGRRVIRSRPLEPLDPERRYVSPDQGHAGVLPGLFSWVGRHRRFKVTRGSFAPDGLRAPTHKHQQQARFQEYFELRGPGKVKFSDPDRAYLVLRNRVIFLVGLGATIVYALYWLLSV